MRRSVYALAFTVFLAGCANLPLFNPESAPPDTSRSASGAASPQKESSSARERNSRLEARLAESTQKIESLSREIRDLEKKNNTLEATVERLRRENIIARSFPAPSPARKGMKPPKSSPGMRDETPKKPGRASITPQALYNKAYRAVRDGKNEAAIRGFRRFLRLFPKNQLAPHSQFWLGEAYYALRQYPEALDEFLNLIKRYPKSRKVPDAYYKRGITYLRRSFPSNATLEFEKLVKKFPTHPLSSKARVQLQNLKYFNRKNP